MTDHEISEDVAESKQLTIEDQKEYHCIECGRLCRVFVFNEPKSCLFDVYKKSFWIKTDKPRWKPKKGERYFFVGDNGMVNFTYAEYDEVDEDYYKFGNCFRTEKQAMKALEKVKETLLKCQEEIE